MINLNNLAHIILLFFCAILIVGGVGLVLQNFKSATYKDTPVTNENVTTISSVPAEVQFANYPVVSNSETIWLDNGTATSTLERDVDYTVISYDEGKFNITDANGLTGTLTVYANYTYKASTTATETTEKGLTGTLNLSGQFPIIGTMIAVGIIIGIIVRVFV